jgi:flagellar basal-body rod protein FlgB
MYDKLFGGDRFVAITRSLDTAALRQQVIAHNLANVNTPGFKRQEVQFETELSRALAQKQNPCAPANCKPVAGIRPQVVTITETGERTDGNNVNLESESIQMATNALRFEVLSQSVGGTFRALRSVINGR